MTALLIDRAEQLTQEHFDVLAQAVQFAERGEIDGWQDDQPFDGMGEVYGAAKHVTTTREPLANFDGKTWRVASGRQDFVIDGCQCLYWREAQALNGQPRVSLTIVDFGGLRLCYQV